MFQQLINIALSSPFFPPAAATAVFVLLWMTADTTHVLSPHERWKRDEDFRQKTHDLEIDFKRKSKALRTRTVLLALLGYSVIWGSVALMFALGIYIAVHAADLPRPFSFAALFGLLPIGFALKLIRALLSRRGGDYGVQLQRKEAPFLFSALDDICKKAGGPPFDRVFICPDMNAMVSRHTGALGFFGFGPVTLTLGLPLLQALSKAQATAVIGHEYGHVAAQDNAIGQWVYRIRSGWLYLGDGLKADTLWYTLRLNRFYRWFMGIFNAYSFTLSRRCEYEADAFAARVAGAPNIASALVAMQLQDTRLHREFWPEIWAKSELIPEPVGAPYRLIGSFFKEKYDAKSDIKALEKKPTKHDSTHPALADRVKALKQQLGAPESLEETAAAALLGVQLERALIDVFDRSWAKQSRRDWKRKYKQHQVAREKFEALAGERIEYMSRENLTEFIEAANVMKQYGAVSAACAEILRREPENMAAKAHMLGFRLMEGTDPAALIRLEDLAREHPEHMAVAARYAADYLTKQGRLQEAAIYEFRLNEWNYQNQAAEEERKNIFSNDVLLPHNMKQDYVDRIRQHLKDHPVVGRAWMVRKEVDYMKGRPFFIVGLKINPWRFKSGRQNLADMKRVTMPVELAPYFRYFWVGRVPGLERRMKKIRGSRIY